MALTAGAVRSIFNEQEPSRPTLQVIDLKKLGNGKIRTILSDGSHYIMGMFATQLTALVESGELKQYSIITLNTYSLNNMGGKKVMIVLKVDVVQLDAAQIGSPQDVAGAPSGAPAAAPQYAAPVQAAPQYAAPAPAAPSYGGAPKAPQSYGASSYGGGAASGAVARADPGAVCQPIDSLNPYQSRWTIKARVTSKGDMKSWNNARGSGTLFKVELLDDRGGEIAACFFKESAEKFYPLLEVNQVYTWSNGRLKVANKQYSSCNSDYEISFGSDADIRLCDEDSSIKTVNFNFRKLDSVEQAEANTTVDVIGIVKCSADCAEIVSKKTGSTLFKRDLTLTDETGIEVSLTLWGDKAKEDDAQWQNFPVLAIKKCKVSDFNGVSLGTLGSSQLMLAPDVPETQALAAWWASGGSSAATRALSTGGMGGGGGGGVRDKSLAGRKALAAIKEENLGQSEKGDYITAKGMVDFILRSEGRDPWYVSDPETKYKCTEQSDGSYFCERLDKTIHNPKRRFIMTASVKDHSGSQLVSLFDDQATQLLGATADEIYEMQMAGQAARVEGIFKRALFYEGYLSLRVKQENYNDELRQKVVCNALAPLDLALESQQLIDAINSYA